MLGTHHAVLRVLCTLCCAQEYKPAKLLFGRPHPDPVVETASLAAVEPPDITYKLKVGGPGRRGGSGW